MLYLYAYYAIKILMNMVLFLFGTFIITIMMSGAISILMLIILVVKSKNLQELSPKPFKTIKPFKIVKFSIIMLLILFIAYLILCYVYQLTLNKLCTDSLSNYSDTEWVSEDSKILITVDDFVSECSAYIMDEDGYIFSYTTQGICRVDNGHYLVEYQLYGRFQGSEFSLYSSGSEQGKHINIYLLNGETFYAEIYDDEQLLGKILKFYRINY